MRTLRIVAVGALFCIMIESNMAAEQQGVGKAPQSVSGKVETKKGDGAVAAVLAPLKKDSQAVAQTVAAALGEAGFTVKALTFDDVCGEGALAPSSLDLLVVPDANVFPARGVRALERYLSAKGRMIVIGAKPFQQWAVKAGGQWYENAAEAKTHAGIKPTSVIQDFESGAIGEWTINAKQRNPQDAITRATPGADGTKGCAQVFIADMQGWMTVVFTPPKPPFIGGAALTCFWAKGDKNTPRLSVSWREKDGSRWIGVAEIGTEWRLITMAPEDFKFWKQGSPASRGKAGDVFNPSNADTFSIGLAASHTGEAPGLHTFWFDQLGCATGTLAPEEKAADLVLPDLSPWYCLYPIEAAAKLVSVSPLTGMKDGGASLPAPKNVFCPVPRCKGQGFLNAAPYRWVPLVEALDASGHRLGHPVSMLVNVSGPRRLAQWAAFTFDDPAAWKAPTLCALLGSVAKRLVDGVAFGEAGSEFMAYYPGETIRLGALAINGGKAPATLEARFRVVSAGEKKTAFEQAVSLTVAAGAQTTVSLSWKPERLDPAGYLVTCELARDGKVIDSISHEFSSLEERGRFDPASAVKVEDGQFTLNGKPWRVVGVNYNPLYYAATLIKEWKHNWLTPGFYQPDVVEEDMKMAAALGLNSLSIQTLDEPDPKALRNLQDMLRRAQRHDLKVNVFLRAAEPMNLRPDALRAIVEGADLASNEAIFAYDISWEPKFGGKKDKKDITKYDNEWTKWVVERYGSIENAEKDWGCKATRKGDGIGAPQDQQLLEDGPWTTMVIAYRRFMNDYVSARFRDSTAALRSLDPHHLVSFRSGSAASGGNPSRGDLPYDYTAVAKSCDMLCPEGWSLKKNPPAARFAVAYCRMVAPRKPVMWAEFGYSAWIKGQRQTDAKGLATMRDVCADFYKIFLDSGSQGGMIWRWTGWYRVDEMSDFGVCGQDRLPRPIWDAIKEYAPRIKEAAPPAEPDAWLAIDTGAHAGGYAYVFQKQSPDLVALYDKGKKPGLKTEATGKTSADVLLVAVGNKPYTGSNPPKYLDAEFNWIRIEDVSGKMVAVKDGGAIEVKSGQPIRAEVSIGNISPVTWLSPLKHEGAGGVFLSSRFEGGLKFEQPIQSDTPSLGDAATGAFILSQGIAQPALAVFEMTAKDRAWFGEKVRVTLKPVSK